MASPRKPQTCKCTFEIVNTREKARALFGWGTLMSEAPVPFHYFKSHPECPQHG